MCRRRNAPRSPPDRSYDPGRPLRAKCCGCTEAFQASRAGSIPVARLRDSHGEWRSLVAHPAGGRAVAGSNPVSPIVMSLQVAITACAVYGHGVRAGSNLVQSLDPVDRVTKVANRFPTPFSDLRPHGSEPGARRSVRTQRPVRRCARGIRPERPRMSHLIPSRQEPDLRLPVPVSERASAVRESRSPPLVRGERLIAQLGDARLRARKEERTVAAGAGRRRARVAWNAIARVRLLLSTDAGARWEPSARRRTPGPRPERLFRRRAEMPPLRTTRRCLTVH